MADLSGFYAELKRSLKRDRILFMPELYELGTAFGLSREQVERAVAETEASGKVLREVALLWMEKEDG